MANWPAEAFSWQKNATPPCAGSGGNAIPRISTIAPGSAPDQLTVTLWLRWTVSRENRLVNVGVDGMAAWTLKAPIAGPPGLGPPPWLETEMVPGSRNPVLAGGPPAGSRYAVVPSVRL